MKFPNRVPIRFPCGVTPSPEQEAPPQVPSQERPGLRVNRRRPRASARAPARLPKPSRPDRGCPGCVWGVPHASLSPREGESDVSPRWEKPRFLPALPFPLHSIFPPPTPIISWPPNPTLGCPAARPQEPRRCPETHPPSPLCSWVFPPGPLRKKGGWRSARGSGSITSWTRRPSASSWKPGTRRNVSCSSPGPWLCSVSRLQLSLQLS